MPQATVHFDGLSDDLIQGGEANWNRGVTPSVCLIRMRPVDGALPPQVGRLDFRLDGSNIISWQNAAIDWATVRVDQGEDGTLWSVQILDRRWEWWQHIITGVYNQQACNGDRINEKNARELVEILLAELGETGADTSDVPTDVYPAVYWNESLVPAELQSLCDKVNCVVHLMHGSNTVKISRLGTGETLPVSHSERIHNTYPVTPHTRPARLQVNTGPTQFQELIRLEAVGLDADCVIKPIDQLSYKPAGGWESQWPQFFSGVSKTYRHLAFQSVYRWYRVYDFGPSRGLELAADITLQNIDEILPLLPTLLEGGVFNDGAGPTAEGTRLTCALPNVRGEFYPYVDLYCNTADKTPDNWDFELDRDNGIVKFHFPVFKIVDQCSAPAVLYLLAAFQQCREDGCWTYRFSRDLSGNGVGTYVLRRPWMVRKLILTSCMDGSGSDNLADIQAEAEAYLRIFPSRWEDIEARDWQLQTLQPVELSGIIAQVKWKCGRMDLSFTRASSYKEFDVFDWSYEQRRRMEFVKQLSHESYRTDR